LAAIAIEAAANAVVEFVGPEYLQFEHFIRNACAHQADTRAVVTDLQARYFGTLRQQRTLVTDVIGGCHILRVEWSVVVGGVL
jgi:hypothetical protein